ncbi:MAG: uroporphyrinogen-III synthase [Luminiphilus sp.]|jgi:uroporphyrinogen-III synthase|nr:uroporphyrinogen-III synthase [Luminiphilus sp.]
MITAVLTRPQDDSERLARILQGKKVHTLILPLMTIVGSLSSGKADPPCLTSGTVVVFVSANAVRFGLPLLKPELDRQENLTFIAIGRKTHDTLLAAGIEALMPTQADSEGLLAMAELSAREKPDVVIVKGEGGRELLADELTRRGAQVTDWVCYRRCWPEVDVSPLLKLSLPIVFQASSGEMLSRLSELLAGEQRMDLFQSPVIVPSERVASLAAGLGWGRVVCAEDASDLAFERTLKSLLSVE